MRYMMMVKADKNYEAGAAPDPRLIAAIGAHVESMARTGALLETGGLLPTTQGARISASGGKLSVTDGPFAESKEVIGGYAILQASSREEAIELGKVFMKIHVDVLGPSYQGELEIRQMSDQSDCGSRARETLR